MITAVGGYIGRHNKWVVKARRLDSQADIDSIRQSYLGHATDVRQLLLRLELRLVPVGMPSRLMMTSIN